MESTHGDDGPSFFLGQTRVTRRGLLRRYFGFDYRDTNQVYDNNTNNKHAIGWLVRACNRHPGLTVTYRVCDCFLFHAHIIFSCPACFFHQSFTCSPSPSVRFFFVRWIPAHGNIFLFRLNFYFFIDSTTGRGRWARIGQAWWFDEQICSLHLKVKDHKQKLCDDNEDGDEMIIISSFTLIPGKRNGKSWF